MSTSRPTPNEEPVATLRLENILESIRSSLPTDCQTIRTAAEALALLHHAMMLTTGFRLIGLHEGQEVSDTHQAEEWQRRVSPLPSVWHPSPDFFAFQYRHHQSAMRFLVKSLLMGDRFLIHGMAVEDKKWHSYHIDVTVAFQDVNMFPVSVNSSTSLETLFSDVYALIGEYKTKILHAFVPGLTKIGYEPTPVSTEAPSTSSGPHQHHPQSNDPLRAGPHRPTFLDEDYRRVPFPGEPFVQNQPILLSCWTRNPFSIGRTDLDPLASLTRPMLPGGGMLVGPEHPMFGGELPRPGWGGDGRTFLPPGAVPPGARFDPVFPMGPGSMPPRPNRPPFGLGGRPRPPGPFGGDPDNDDLPPPGYGDMFM